MPLLLLDAATGDRRPASGDRRPATGDRRPASGDRMPGPVGGPGPTSPGPVGGPGPGVALAFAFALTVSLTATSTARAQAQPWLVAPAENVEGTDALVSVAPLLGGDTCAVVFENGGALPNARIHLVHHTLVDGPLLSLPVHAYGATVSPSIVWDGDSVIASGSGSAVQVSGDGGTVFNAVSASIFDVIGVALDPAGSGVALASISNGGIFTNGARSQTAGASFVDVDIGNSSSDVPESVAVRGDRALAIANFGVLGASDVLLGNWTNLGQPPVGIAADAPLVALAAGGFAAVGSGGAGFYVDDLAVGPILDCGPGGDDLTALATDGVALWIAKAGTVLRVDDPASCPWDQAEAFDTGLDAINALAAAGPREVIAFGDLAGAPSIAWRNRPPAVVTPVLATVTLDEDESLTQTFVVADPDVAFGDELTFAWTCDLAIVTDGDQATAVLRGFDGAACPGDADVTSSCAVTATDSDGQVATNAFVVVTTAVDVLPPQASAVGAVTVTPGVLVDEGTPLTAAAAFSDACLDVIEWTLFAGAAASGEVVLGPVTQPFGAPFAFTAPNVALGAQETFTLRAHAIDRGDNTLDRDLEIVVVGVAPPAAVLTCDASLFAGETAAASAAPAVGSGPIADFVWTASRAGADVPFVETGDAIEVATDRCDHGSDLVISVVPSAPNGDGPAQQCTIPLDRAATPPTLAAPASLDLPLGPAGVRVALPTNAVDCAQESVLVTWDLTALAALVDVDATITVPSGFPILLTLGTGAGDVTALLGPAGQGTSVVVTGSATDDAGATSAPVDVELRFFANPDLGDLAGIALELAFADTRALEPGALVEVTGALTSDLAIALPSLRLALVEDGLRIVPDTARVTSECPQVTGALEDGALVVDGVTEACPAAVSFLARRGLADGGLTVGACAWGPSRAPVARCAGGIDVASPPALSCASTSSPLGGCSALFALAIRALRRRRR